MKYICLLTQGAILGFLLTKAGFGPNDVDFWIILVVDVFSVVVYGNLETRRKDLL